MNAHSLPSAEYKVTFTDFTVTLLAVHPHQSLEASLEEMLQAAGSALEEVASVTLYRTYLLEEEFGELLP